MQTEINGQVYALDGLRPDEPAVEFIRNRAGLTGTKLVCGTGVCGACTVLVDGQPLVSCLLPAQALAGRSVRTIEAYETDLHPVQKAFMACDGLQCGFCTPGFINEGIAFYEQYRQVSGQTRPDREEVIAALSGHLCRCGAYAGIIEAMQRACAGEVDTGEVVSPRVEALAKVTGRAKYTVDIRLPGQLEGRILRSPHPHARIRAVDLRAAAALPGVKAAVEFLDEDRVVRYVGQRIAAVAAVDRQTAEQALALIQVDYEVLPAVIGMAAARLPDAPPVYEGLLKKPPSSAEEMLLPGSWKGNLRRRAVNPTAWRGGKARSLIELARKLETPYLVEGQWRTQSQSHTPLEPHACVAVWENDEQLTVYLSTQSCHPMARQIAEQLGLKAEQVRVLCEHIGGGFGSKLSLGSEAIIAARLSRAAGAAVRVVLDRDEEMTVGGHRPGAEINLALLANKEGDMESLSVEVYGDGGISVGTTIAALMGLIYPNSPRRLDDYDVVNHTPPGKPFRGPGGPVACWALEQAVDEMAYRLDQDAVTLRRRWDNNPLRQQLYDWVETIPAWQERGSVGGETGRFRRGIGLAAANWFYFFLGETEIEVMTSPDGIIARTASQDMGNGTRTVIATAVAGVFGIAPTEVIVQIGDSQAVRGPQSGGSRTTSSVYYPARQAASQVMQQLIEEAQGQLGLEQVRLIPGGLEYAGGRMTWLEICRAVPSERAVVGRGRDRGLPAVPLAFGADDQITGRGFTGAVHLSEVEVDTRLGKIRPLRVWGGLAVGRIIVPVLARSQCYGGIIQGLGYALYETRQLDLQTGQTLTLGLEDYHIPGIGDTPEMELHFVEEGFEHARGQGVGLAELSTLAVAASVGNAVFHATGWRPYDLPIRPERLLQGIRR